MLWPLVSLRQLAMCACLALLVGCATPVAPLPVAPEPMPTPAAALALPQDAGPHDALTEWWYYTGHLMASDGHAYGFEFVIFQVRRQDQPTGYLAHYAISDITGQAFSHQARFLQSPLPASGFPLDVGGWSLDHHGNVDTLDAAMSPGAGVAAPFVLHLSMQDAKPPALHHGGYITYPPPVGGSYYYSRTRLAVSGTLGVGDGEPAPVSGTAWMDHQWGNFVIAAQDGWDWYSLQFDDNTELMLYVLRTDTGESSAAYGTYILANGEVQDLAPGAVVTEPIGSWTSPHTGGVYPSGWALSLPDGSHIALSPLLEDQELWFPETPGLLQYWEGAVAISGDHTGQGYVELTGYAK
jgi:predicted secreted hydrolase